VNAVEMSATQRIRHQTYLDLPMITARVGSHPSPVYVTARITSHMNAMESMKKRDEHQRRGRGSAGTAADTRIDDAVLRATVELLEEIGYTRLTIPLVARARWGNPTSCLPTLSDQDRTGLCGGVPRFAERRIGAAGDLESVFGLILASIDLFSRRRSTRDISLMAEMPPSQAIGPSACRFKTIPTSFCNSSSTRSAEGRALRRRRPPVSGHDQWHVMMSLANERTSTTPGRPDHRPDRNGLAR